MSNCSRHKKIIIQEIDELDVIDEDFTKRESKDFPELSVICNMDNLTELKLDGMIRYDMKSLLKYCEFYLDNYAYSVNSFYKSWKGRIVIPKEAKMWKNDIETFIVDNVLPQIRNPITLTLGFFFKTRRKRDIDNCFKPLIDIFKNRLFEDDDQIYVLNAFKRIGCKRDVIYVKVKELDYTTIYDMMLYNDEYMIKSSSFVEISDLIGMTTIGDVDLENMYRFNANRIEFYLDKYAYSVNAYYREWNGKMRILPEGKTWKKEILEMITTWRLPKLEGKISMTIGYFFEKRIKRDIDNCFKPLLDVFKDTLFGDDDMIYDLKSFKKIGCKRNCIYVSICKISDIFRDK